MNLEQLPTDTKMTKAQILSMYNSAVATIQHNKSQAVGAEKVVRDKKVAETKAITSQMTVENSIGTIREYLDKYAVIVEQQFGKLNTLEEMINIKQAELEDILGIEKEALNLLAFVDTKNAIADKFDNDAQAKKEALTAQLEEIKNTLTADIEELKKKQAHIKEAFDIEHARRVEEFNYQHSRNTKAAIDGLEDRLSEIRANNSKLIEQKMNTLKEKEKVVEEREKEALAALESFEDMKTEIENIPFKIEAAVKAAEGKLAGIMKHQFENEKKILELQNANEINNLRDKNTMLEQRVEQLMSDNETLSDKLTTAYSEIKDMANKAFESASGKKELESVMKFAEQNQKNNSGK